jgi:hypothetical protein
MNTKQQLANYQFERKMYLQSLMNAHVRWPARPAEFLAGLDLKQAKGKNGIYSLSNNL